MHHRLQTKRDDAVHEKQIGNEFTKAKRGDALREKQNATMQFHEKTKRDDAVTKNEARQCSSRITKRNDAVREKQNATMQFTKNERTMLFTKNKCDDAVSRKTKRDDAVKNKMRRCSSRKTNATMQFARRRSSRKQNATMQFTFAKSKTRWNPKPPTSLDHGAYVYPNAPSSVVQCVAVGDHDGLTLRCGCSQTYTFATQLNPLHCSPECHHH